MDFVIARRAKPDEAISKHGITSTDFVSLAMTAQSP